MPGEGAPPHRGRVEMTVKANAMIYRAAGEVRTSDDTWKCSRRPANWVATALTKW